MDWRLVPASLLVMFALWVLAGLALACSTRLEMIPTLAICTGLFLVGLMSQYFFGARVAAGSWWATVLYTVTPNWQVFWLADKSSTRRRERVFRIYVGPDALMCRYVYVGAVLRGGALMTV